MDKPELNIQSENVDSLSSALEHYLYINNYRELGYILKSLVKVAQTALMAEIESPDFIEHDKWDIYNLLTLIKNLIPEEELEWLDKLMYRDK